MKQKDLIPLLLLGVGVYMFMNYRKNPQQVMNVPPIQPGQPGWTQTVKDVVSTAGGVIDALFGPNGPFRNMSKDQVKQALAEGYTYDNVDYGSNYNNYV